MTAHRTDRANPSVYRPAIGASPAHYAAEQDAAAGGHQARLVSRADGSPAAASVALRCFPRSRRVYAYLRWTETDTKTHERYLGDVSDLPDRATALDAAWSRAHAIQAAAPNYPSASSRTR